MLRTAVLISGSGRTLQNFIDLQRAGKLPIEIVLVVSSRSDVRGIEIARQAGIPVEIIPRRGCAEPEFSKRITAAIDAAHAELICLAGFLCKWDIPDRYQW